MRRSIATLVMMLLGITGGLLVRGGPALADTRLWVDCASARICLWNSTNYGGTPFQVTTGYIKTLPADCLVLTASYNNWASSVGDKTSHIGGERIVFFDYAGGGASFASITSNWGDLNLGASPAPSTFN